MRTQLIATALTRIDKELVADEGATIVVDLDDPDRPLDHGGAPVDVGSHRILLALADDGDKAGLLASLLRVMREPTDGPVHEQLYRAFDEVGGDAVLAAVVIAGGLAYVLSIGAARAYLLRDDRVRDLGPAAVMTQVDLCRGDRFVLCSAGDLELPLRSSTLDACMDLLDGGHASAIVADVDGDALLRPHQLVPCGVLIQRSGTGVS